MFGRSALPMMRQTALRSRGSSALTIRPSVGAASSFINQNDALTNRENSFLMQKRHFLGNIFIAGRGWKTRQKMREEVEKELNMEKEEDLYDKLPYYEQMLIRTPEIYRPWMRVVLGMGWEHRTSISFLTVFWPFVAGAASAVDPGYFLGPVEVISVAVMTAIARSTYNCSLALEKQWMLKNDSWAFRPQNSEDRDAMVESGERYLNETELKILLGAHVPVLTGLVACSQPLVQGVTLGLCAPATALAFWKRNDANYGIATKALAISTTTVLGAAFSGAQIDMVVAPLMATTFFGSYGALTMMEQGDKAARYKRDIFQKCGIAYALNFGVAGLLHEYSCGSMFILNAFAGIHHWFYVSLQADRKGATGVNVYLANQKTGFFLFTAMWFGMLVSRGKRRSWLFGRETDEVRAAVKDKNERMERIIAEHKETVSSQNSYMPVSNNGSTQVSV